jgi:hypothetical protein
MELNKMEASIREAKHADRAEIVRLISEHASLSNESIPRTAEYVVQYLASTIRIILLAEIDGKIAGLLSYSLRPNLCYALMTELFARLLGNECVEISVAVMPDNLQAIHFYRSNRFFDEALLLEMHLHS